MSAPPVIDTERLMIRPVVPADLDALRAIVGDAEPIERWMQRVNRSYAASSAGFMALVRLADLVLIGYAGVDFSGDAPVFEVRLREAARGQGYESEAERALLADARERLRVNGVTARRE